MRDRRSLLEPSRVARRFDSGAGDDEEIVWRNRCGAQRLVEALPIDRCSDLLDAGCGTGVGSLAVLGRFQPRSITASTSRRRCWRGSARRSLVGPASW